MPDLYNIIALYTSILAKIEPIPVQIQIITIKIDINT